MKYVDPNLAFFGVATKKETSPQDIEMRSSNYEDVPQFGSGCAELVTIVVLLSFVIVMDSCEVPEANSFNKKVLALQ